MKNLKQFTIDLAKEAGKIVKQNYGKIKEQELKADDTFVTNVDLEAEKLIISRIKEKFPEHHIISEEAGDDKRDSEYAWIIDPIDGTRNFMHNIPLFSVSIGIAKNNKPYIGVVYFPITNELFSAEKGKGAYLNDKKIHVSERGLKDSPVMAYGANVHKGTDWHMKKIPEFLKVIKRMRLLGNATTNMCFLAAGRFDSYIARFGKVWDFAGSFVIVEEAGGKITDLQGKPYTLETEDFVVSNNKFHDELIKITKGE